MSSIIPIFIPHVGCPHDCVFCNQKRIAGTQHAPTSSEVKEIILNALKNTGDEAPAVAFYGGSFTALSEKLMCQYLGAVREFADSGDVCGIRLSTRPDCIDKTILDMLCRHGVKTIELGVQSMSDSVLEKAGRGHTADDALRASALIKEYGFELILQMMAGLPGATEEDDIKTAKAICEMRPDGVRIYPVVVIRDTELEYMWKRGEYVPMSVETAAKLGGRLLSVFADEGIPVIRFGLNPTDDLSGGDALAGAYHPALGELAQSERYLDIARRELAKKGNNECVEIYVSPTRVSAMAGHKKKNREVLADEFGIKKLRILGDANVRDGEVRIVAGGQIHT